jgi:hypothetical protein
MSFEPRCLATAIGSLPHAQAGDAARVVLANIPDAPIWPQLPANGINEQMEVQYNEGIPRVVIDREKQRMFVDTTGDTSMELAAFYEKFVADDVDAFAISAEFSEGIPAMEAALQAAGGTRPYVKVQTTGPISFGLTIVDENKRAIYYNAEFNDVIVKALAMKCRWQIRKFRPYASEGVICFIDEPILSAFGSSTYVSVTRDDVVAKVNELVEAIHAEGALAGVHCCGNTEWSILIDAGVDIVNFDAFSYGDTIALYPEAVKAHLERGGALAWGVVPTSGKINTQSVESLMAKLDEGVDNLAARAGISRDLIMRQALITPSCGTGSLPVADAERVFDLLGKTSQALRRRLGAGA